MNTVVKYVLMLKKYYKLITRKKTEESYINHEHDNKLIKFDFRAGNKCNLSCRMCHPESSSMREEEEIKFNNASQYSK